jgi:hypothetical protein
VMTVSNSGGKVWWEMLRSLWPYCRWYKRWTRVTQTICCLLWILWLFRLCLVWGTAHHELQICACDRSSCVNGSCVRPHPCRFVHRYWPHSSLCDV